MRIIDSIPHPKFTISIFSMNDKYLVKIEAGPMEQMYKFFHDEVSGVDALKKIIDEQFLSSVHEHFNAMFISLKSAKERNTKGA
jgi:hypothetical protein